jgi:hypothetical protein
MHVKTFFRKSVKRFSIQMTGYSLRTKGETLPSTGLTLKIYCPLQAFRLLPVSCVIKKSLGIWS